MKKLLFLLFLLPFMAMAQVSTGQEQDFDYGIKNNSSQQILTPDTLVTKGVDGTYGHTSAYRLPVSTATQDTINTKIASNAGLQNAYNFEPEIVTSAIKGAVTVQEGTGNDANNVLVGKNNAGTTTFSVSGTGDTDVNQLKLPNTDINSSSKGFVLKNSLPFIHDFHAGANPVQGGTGKNLNIGYNSGNFNSDNFNYASTMVGYEAGLSNKNGYSNTGIGYFNLRLNEDGFGNTALGTFVLGNSVSGTQNTALGWHSMLYSTSASSNTAVGVESLWNNLTGARNTAIGMRSGSTNTGSDNVFIGYNAGSSFTGSNALYVGNNIRTLIQGNFSGNGFLRLNGAGEFVVAPTRKIIFNNPTGVEASIGWVNDINSPTNAYLDAFDYRFRTGGVVRLQIENSGAATFSSSITATTYTGSATLTGTPTAPTAPAGTNTTQIATTAFVQANKGSDYRVSISGNNYMWDNIRNGTTTGYITFDWQESGLQGKPSGFVFNGSNTQKAYVRMINASSDGDFRIGETFDYDGNRYVYEYKKSTSTSPGWRATNNLKLGTSTAVSLTVDTMISNGKIRLKSYTVATLPTGTQGDTAYVTDAVSPTYLGTLTGGGSVVCPVFYNGTAWVSH